MYFFVLLLIRQTVTKPVPTTVPMMLTAIAVTIHPQRGVSDGIVLFTLTFGPSCDGVSVSVELLIWSGAVFAGAVFCCISEAAVVPEEVDSVASGEDGAAVDIVVACEAS